MKSTKQIVLALAAFSMIACSSPEEKEIEATESGPEIPEAVLNTFNSGFADATEIEWEREGEEYSVSFMKDGQDYEAEFDANGNLLEAEVTISIDELPMLAQDYVSENYPDAQISAIQKEMNSNGNFYEVELKMGDTEMELFFDVNGEFLEAEIEEGEEEEDEDENAV